jgi:hypothetical protein
MSKEPIHIVATIRPEIGQKYIIYSGGTASHTWEYIGVARRWEFEGEKKAYASYGLEPLYIFRRTEEICHAFCGALLISRPSYVELGAIDFFFTVSHFGPSIEELTPGGAGPKTTRWVLEESIMNKQCTECTNGKIWADDDTVHDCHFCNGTGLVNDE